MHEYLVDCVLQNLGKFNLMKEVGGSMIHSELVKYE